MHSAAGIEDRLFTPARVRLTAWYVAVLAAVLVVLGTALYLVVRDQLLSSVDNGVKLVAARASAQWTETGEVRVLDLSTGPYTVNYVPLSQMFGQAGRDRNGKPHFDPAAMAAAVQSQSSSDLRTSGASGDRQRVYSVLANGIAGMAVIQVSRSLEPEHEALGKLLAGLLVGGFLGLLGAAVGGWFLAGKSLRPVRVAFDRQHAFVADASHELRTPLAVIRANAEFLSHEQPDNAEAREILGETDRLSGLVDALLAVARGDDAAPAPADVIDVAELAQATVASFQPLAAERRLELTVATEERLDVPGDADQLRQVLLILLDNAVRYSGEGGRIHVQARANGSSALLTVHDTGIGIPANQLEHIFERFYRGDDARNRQSGGAGLGLAIARELVNRHNGKLTVASTEGAGSTFTVQLPRSS